MKPVFLIIAITLAGTFSSAQDAFPAKIRVGLFANVGTSSLDQGMGMNMNMYGRNYGGLNGNSMTMNGYVGSWGGGVNLTVPMYQRWSIVGNIGYMYSEASYAQMYTTYDSRYHFSYLNVWVMGQYNSLPRGPVKFTAVLGLTENILLSATNHTPGTNQNMMDYLNRVNVGLVLGPGLEARLKGKGAIQARLLYTYGFMNAFRGMDYDSGMHSSNAALVLQMGYLFN